MLAVVFMTIVAVISNCFGKFVACYVVRYYAIALILLDDVISPVRFYPQNSVVADTVTILITYIYKFLRVVFYSSARATHFGICC